MYELYVYEGLMAVGKRPGKCQAEHALCCCYQQASPRVRAKLYRYLLLTKM